MKNNKIRDGNLYITQLFCIGYIKVFCYTFIQLFDEDDFHPENIIDIINKNDKINMVKLYIYKIIYNKNNKQINAFLDNDIKEKFKLNQYEGFNEFIRMEDMKKLEQFNFDENQSNILMKLKECEGKHFKNKITKDDINLKRSEFDNFYMAAYKLILSKLVDEDFENNISYTNFYSNICEPLYDDKNNKSNKLISLMKLFFEKETYQKIKEDEKINSEDIIILLYGYRYCLNEVKTSKGESIYSYLYDINNRDDFNKKFYPGNDNNNKEPYYELYSQIEDHFANRPEEGCFVCLCKEGYYHSISTGFPDKGQINIVCPKCGYEIGAKEQIKVETKEENGENKDIDIKVYETVESNDHYYRIFKDEEEIKDLKNKDESKFEKLNYMTVKEFKERYIKPLDKLEKGLNQIDINLLKKENRKIRNLSQISYRLLNYILLCHLFFAKLFTQSATFDDYIPKGISWMTMIKECFNRLKVELENKGIKQIEIFMNFVFKDLFDKLHKRKCIDNFEDLVEFEKELEKLIEEKCENVIEEINRYEELEKKCLDDKNSGIALIKEIYDKSLYKLDFPFYEYFYYTFYLDEDYIYDIIKNKDENNYPVLVRYLKNKMEDKDEDNYSSDNLALFNKVLKLFNDKYSNQISRDEAREQTIKKSEIYEKNNVKLINKFIAFYNKVEKDNGNELNLDKEKNHIIDFLLIDDNEYGKSYKKIYNEFIKKQNELEDLLDIKINNGEFNSNCKNKISIQKIKEKEIFSLSQKCKFNRIVFNSSYRKFIDTKNYKDYDRYELRLNQIESEMTDSLVKNKKLVNNELKEFSFNNEVFNNEITDIISNFNNNYKEIPINLTDKVIIYNFIEGRRSLERYKNMINDFIALINYLNKSSKDKNNTISSSTKIIDIVKNLNNISEEDFPKLFQDENLIVGKITDIFNCFLKLIFKDVKEDIKKHQEQNTRKDYKLEDKDFKKELAEAIRKFITLVLFREEEIDKDKKIKDNEKNIVDYLKKKDLWKSYDDDKSSIETNLLKIKGLLIKIKEIVYFYDYLVGTSDEIFENEIVEYIKEKNREEEEKKEREKILIKEEAKKPKTNIKKKPKGGDISDEEEPTKKKKTGKKPNKKKKGDDW